MITIKKIFDNIRYLAHRPRCLRPSFLLNLANYFMWLKKETVRYQPLHITCYITDSCTLSCSFCPHHSPDRDTEYPYLHEPVENMTFVTFKKIIDTFPGTPWVSLCGVGEPFLNKEIYRMIDYAIEKGKLVFIVTNGTLLSNHVREIARRKIFGFNISLNCIDQNTFNHLTNTDKYDFNEITSSIQELISLNGRDKIKISLSFVVRKEKISDIERALDFISQKLPGISKATFHNLIYFGIDESFPLSEVVIESDTEAGEYLEAIRKKAEKYPFALGLPKLRPEAPEDIICNDFFTQLHVDARGNVSGCGRSIAPNREFGNVLQEGREVWNNAFFREMRAMILNKNFKDHPVCRNCVGA